MIRELAELQEKDAARVILQQTPVSLSHQAGGPRRFLSSVVFCLVGPVRQCMEALEHLQPQRHRRLLQCIQRPYFNIADAYGDDHAVVLQQQPSSQGSGPDAGSAMAVKERVRERIARAVEREVREVPVSRLMVLLNRALKWQVHTGQLSLDSVAEAVASGQPGFDLLQGKVAGAAAGPAEGEEMARGEEESHPATLVHKIKVSVVCSWGRVCVCVLLVWGGQVGTSSLVWMWQDSIGSLCLVVRLEWSGTAPQFKKSQCEAAVFSPNGQFLLSGDSEGFLEVYDSGTGKLSKKLKFQAEVGVCARSDGGRSVTSFLLSLSSSRPLIFWSPILLIFLRRMT